MDMINKLLLIAATEGYEAAVEARAEMAANEYDSEIEARVAEDERLARYGYDDGEYVPGCGQDDTVDSRGRPLRPRVNEAGEPYWI